MGLLVWLFVLGCNDFFLPFATIYLHFDLLYMTSPQERLYFFLFSANIYFNTLGSSSTDRLFHFFWLWDVPLTLLSFIWGSAIERVFLLLPTFLSLILSLQKALRSTFSLDFERLPLTSEAINEEWGLAIIRLAREAFYFQSFKTPQGSWPL